MAADQGEDLDVDFSTNKPDTTVIDEAKYSHKRRLRAIHNAHDRAIDVRNTVEEYLIQKSITELDARRYYRGAVESYIMEVMPLLRSDLLDLEEYAEDVKLGTVTLTPPPELVEFARENIDRMPPGGSVPQPVSHPIEGLVSILELPSPLSKRFTVTLRAGGSGTEHRSEVVRTELSRKLLDTALQTTTEALEEAEMGLNIGEGKPRRSMGIDGKWPWEADGIEMPHIQLRKQQEQDEEAPADD